MYNNTNMLDNLKKYKVILASASPRRRELLAGIDVDFEVRVLPDVDESFPDTQRGHSRPQAPYGKRPRERLVVISWFPPPRCFFPMASPNKLLTSKSSSQSLFYFFP